MADPGATARKQIQKNMPKLGSINIKVSYFSLNNPSYDPSSGIVADDLNLNFFVSGPFLSVGSFDSAQTDDDPVLAIDKAFLAPALNFPAEPKINDELLDPAGTVWRVKGIKTDPASATHKLWIRPKDHA